MPLSSYEYSGTNIPAFLTKLWTLVEDKKYDELIAWDPTGYSFHVFDQTRFAREILPRFFKHNNMASFIRQLNMYGFRKLNSVEQGSLKNEKDDMEFHHPYFVKNKEHMLELIKRKVPSSTPASHQIKKEDNNEDIDTSNASSSNATASSSSASSPSKNAQIQTTENLVAILHGVKSMHSKQEDVVERLQFLKRENEALWKEVSALRQKHHQQQQIVNKLIQFLVHLVNPATMGIKRNRPLMIDSHSTLTNINDSGSSKRTNEDNEEGPLKKQKMSEERLKSNKGVIINDITDLFMKQSQNDYNDEDDDEDDDLKIPFVDLVNDSPQQQQNQLNDGNDDYFLNSNLFLNSDVNYNEIDKNESIIKTNNEIFDLSSKIGISTNTSDTTTTTTARPLENTLKRTISGSQLMDHVESFQFDLNSIKEFLNTNHNLDQSFLNHLFSQNEEIDLLQPLVDRETIQPGEFKSEENRITGSEVVQFEPTMNPELLFNMEDVFLPSSSNTNAPSASNAFLTASIPTTVNNNENPSSVVFDDEDFIIDQDFTDANILLDSTKLNSTNHDNYSNKIITRQKSSRK